MSEKNGRAVSPLAIKVDTAQQMTISMVNQRIGVARTANSHALLKQADLTRYAKGLKAAGISEFRVEIDTITGKVVIIAGDATAKSGGNPCDRLLK